MSSERMTEKIDALDGAEGERLGAAREKAALYCSLPGELGDRLRFFLQEDAGVTYLTLEDGRCPMWRADGVVDDIGIWDLRNIFCTGDGDDISSDTTWLFRDTSTVDNAVE